MVTSRGKSLKKKIDTLCEQSGFDAALASEQGNIYPETPYYYCCYYCYNYFNQYANIEQLDIC